ncbi:MAG: tRNA (adenosine(37)-N6)-threonylcarbamoyltransferase complex ATPase subunit type 1 TsaE [Gammaproteobacteria bacterium]|nr:tRNA (adenosine(37)-N6)-threonylcarbamoyltransferase complex ATPase subunit type 1 TsaE [Gammaproteobacteria bacterium]MDH3750634.1 tRNA (adenosine(37)-N6)-threonylcarbamoyltransferase complex ATPase subunit type 1 TsaE [Gammaproteobacteria bacterium]MDH3804347.1 tRNA (adenosine(37)-N6)-threonylcarbamoyltransferase complex ATPase subunit type 1 TsaE [Gammaproteobacteria bacterium]
MRVHLPDAAATDALATRLHAVLPADTAGWTLLLEGELGAGKSTFARALILAMGHDGPVPSPTYTLVEPYQLSGRTIYHVDLYRIADEDELRYLGWSELEKGFRLVEWPERAPSLAHAADLRILLSYSNAGRDAEVIALSPRGVDLVSRLEPIAST